MPGAIGRVLRTLRHLRPRQAYGQLRRRLVGPVAPRRAGGSEPRLAVRSAVASFLPPAAHAATSSAREVRLLERSAVFAGPPDWDHAFHGPLWQFHLHYHEWVRSAALAPEERLALLLDWVGRHRRGVGWGPAPTSLRAFQWAKLLLDERALPRDAAQEATLVRSLADQLATLARAREYDLGANHYLFNLLALVLGGVLIEGAESERWLGFEAALRREIVEQVDRDGAHYERSPMYHALVLEALLDLLNVGSAAGARLGAATRDALRDAASRMRGALALWTHPDGEIALFGDSAFGVAAGPSALSRYAETLGVPARGPRSAGLLAEAGFVRREAGPFVLIASVAGPQPAYQPGHAHCDALAFELSAFGERVVTDTGVCEYVPGRLRDVSRATRSHATLEVEAREQAELWAAHRVGGRPDVRLTWLGAGGFEATCAGWATPHFVHRRRFDLDAGGLSFVDSVDEGAPSVLASLPLAPGVGVRLDGRVAWLETRGGRRFRVDLPGGLVWAAEPTPYLPAFGRTEERLSLRGRGALAGPARWAIRPL